MQQVRDLMSRNVLTVTADLDIQSLARKLAAAHISGAPVVDDKGKLIGVVSRHDLASHERPAGGSETAAYWQGDPRLPGGYSVLDLSQSEKTVEQIMTPAVYSIDEDAGLVELCDFFLKGEIHRVLVTRKGKLAGIVTPTDMIRCLRQQLTQPISTP